MQFLLIWNWKLKMCWAEVKQNKTAFEINSCTVLIYTMSLVDWYFDKNFNFKTVVTCDINDNWEDKPNTLWLWLSMSHYARL